MCLAIPLRVASIDGDKACVELSGVLREVSTMLTPEAQVGDYVLVHTGFSISVLDENEAQETLALFAELAEAERELILQESEQSSRPVAPQATAS